MNAGYVFTIMSSNSKGQRESKNGGGVKGQYEKQKIEESEQGRVEDINYEQTD